MKIIRTLREFHIKVPRFYGYVCQSTTRKHLNALEIASMEGEFTVFCYDKDSKLTKVDTTIIYIVRKSPKS